MTALRAMVGLALLMVAGASLAQDARPELSKALDYAHGMFIAYRLDPTAEDLAALLRASRNIVRLQSERDKQHVAALVKATADMKAARDAMLAGQAVPQATQEALDRLVEAETREDEDLHLSVADEIRLLRGQLSEETARLVSWQVPWDYPLPPDDEANVERLEQMAARITSCGNMLESIRYLNAADFVTTRMWRLEEFLDEYDIEPNTKEYEEALDYLTRLTDEMRVLPEEQWPDAQFLYAARALVYVGGLEIEQEEDNLETLFTFWDIHDFLSDPQTPELLSKLLNALNTNVGGGQ